MERDHFQQLDLFDPDDRTLPELPRDPEEKGFVFFREERERAIERVNERFGAMIGKQVRVKLWGWDDEFVGKLKLNALLLPQSKKDEVPLRIGRVEFDLRDIEHCLRVREGAGQ